MVTSIGLVQMNWGLQWQHSEGNQGLDSVSYSFLPYSTGLLQAYAQRHLSDPERFVWYPHLHSRLAVSEAVDQLKNADIVGFSAYVWNIQLSLAIAKELKAANPDVLIVFGGPQVPDRAEQFLRSYQFIDIACHGEGESTFTAILERHTERDWSGIPGVSYLITGGKFIFHQKAARSTDLSEYPSPYLEGMFDQLVAGRPDERWVMTWETNRGCPFSCTFCDWGSATASRVYTFGLDRLQSELEWAAKHKIGSLVCCDANFGMLPRDVEITKMVIKSRQETNYPYSFAIQNAKNSTERSFEIQRMLAKSMHTIGVTLALQTTNPETLRNIRRSNIKMESYRELQRRFMNEGIYTYTDVIIGLPGESYEGFADSVSKVIADGQHNHIQFHNCSVLPNAEMGDPEYSSRFGMVTVPQPIRAVYAPAYDLPEIEELLDTVVTTDAMNAPDWVRSKVFAWMTDLLYFDRLLQIPMFVVGRRFGVPHRFLVEALVDNDPVRYPTLAWAAGLLRGHARTIQSGGIEFFQGGPGGPILWPADQYIYTLLVGEGRLDAYYSEAKEAFGDLLGDVEDLLDAQIILDECFTLNRALLCLPFNYRDAKVVLSHDILRYWRESCAGKQAGLEESMTVYQVNRTSRTWDSIEGWSEFLTWCQGRDKREYLYEATAISNRIDATPSEPTPVSEVA